MVPGGDLGLLAAIVRITNDLPHDGEAEKAGEEVAGEGRRRTRPEAAGFLSFLHLVGDVADDTAVVLLHEIVEEVVPFQGGVKNGPEYSLLIGVLAQEPEREPDEDILEVVGWSVVKDLLHVPEVAPGRNLVQNGVVKLPFRWEVLKDQGIARSHLVGDVLDAGPPEPLPGEQVDGRPNDQVTSFFGRHPAGALPAHV